MEERKQSRKNVKVYLWITCSAASLHLSWCYSSANEDGRVRDMIAEEIERTGVPMHVAAEEASLSPPPVASFHHNDM